MSIGRCFSQYACPWCDGETRLTGSTRFCDHCEHHYDPSYLRDYHRDARIAELEAELKLSREQTEYANDAMMAMCKRAEQAEDSVERRKVCGSCSDYRVFGGIGWHGNPATDGVSFAVGHGDSCHFAPSRWAEREGA